MCSAVGSIGVTALDSHTSPILLGCLRDTRARLFRGSMGIKFGLIELLPIVDESKGLLCRIVCPKGKKRLYRMLLVGIDDLRRLITEKRDSLEGFHNHGTTYHGVQLVCQFLEAMGNNAINFILLNNFLFK
jgi:hypothetical protein